MEDLIQGQNGLQRAGHRVGLRWCSSMADAVSRCGHAAPDGVEMAINVLSQVALELTRKKQAVVVDLLSCGIGSELNEARCPCLRDVPYL